MAEDFLEEIYREAELCCEIKQAVQYAKIHDTLNEVVMGNMLLPKLGELCRQYLEQEREKGLELWEHIQTLQEVPDPILAGDTLECRILPLVQEHIRSQGKIETENEEGDYLFESTASGFLTIKNLNDDRYFHSTIDPMWEARQIAEYIYTPQKAQYAIRGCGLGYLIYQLYKYSFESAVIHVFEKDARMVEYARRYGVLDWVPETNLKIVVDENPNAFLADALQKQNGMYIFVPELYNEREDVQPILKDLNIQYSTRNKLQKNKEINCWSNIRQNCKKISEFDYSGLSKDMIVVAGGPSVDDNMEFLRESQGKKTLIAVGTVFHKLIRADIIPDIVAIIDSDSVTYNQVAGLEEQKVPMLLAMGASWKIAAHYQGEKYLISTTDLADLPDFPAEFYEEPWEVGGTVTSMAVEAALRFGAERIYLVGVDMAFPGGITHAEGTAQREKKAIERLKPIEGVGGGVVYTDDVFWIYLRQLEEKIAKSPQVIWYNMSRIGARIAGTIEQNN